MKERKAIINWQSTNCYDKEKKMHDKKKRGEEKNKKQTLDKDIIMACEERKLLILS